MGDDRRDGSDQAEGFRADAEGARDEEDLAGINPLDPQIYWEAELGVFERIVHSYLVYSIAARVWNRCVAVLAGVLCPLNLSQVRGSRVRFVLMRRWLEEQSYLPIQNRANIRPRMSSV